MSEEFSIAFIGFVPAKKNRYRPTGRSGKSRFFKDDKLCAALDLLDSQIPESLRGLHLEHPDIEWDFQVRNEASDRDNKMTTLLDILVSAGVLKNDNIKRCNGKWVVNPAQIVPDQEETTIVTIRPRSVPVK